MEKRLLTIKELREYTGVGKNRAYRLAEESGARIPIGKKIYIDRLRLDRFLDQLQND